jgi:hypothetical protein
MVKSIYLPIIQTLIPEVCKKVGKQFETILDPIVYKLVEINLLSQIYLIKSSANNLPCFQVVNQMIC